MSGLTITAESDAYYLYLGKVKLEPGIVKKTVQARDDDKWLVNLDYDKDGVLIGIEILQHYHEVVDEDGIEEILNKSRDGK